MKNQIIGVRDIFNNLWTIFQVEQIHELCRTLILKKNKMCHINLFRSVDCLWAFGTFAFFSSFCSVRFRKPHLRAFIPSPSTEVKGERSSMAMTTDGKSIAMPASRSGKNATTRHHGLRTFQIETVKCEDRLQKWSCEAQSCSSRLKSENWNFRCWGIVCGSDDFHGEKYERDEKWKIIFNKFFISIWCFASICLQRTKKK